MDSMKGKIEGEVEVRAAGGEVFHDLYANRPHHAPNAVPHILEGCDLHEGEFGKPGKIISWKFTTTGGKPIYIKCRVIEIDKEEKLVRQEVVEGDYLKDYKTLIGTNQVIPKDNETSIVKWTLEYEKLRPEVPEPTDLLNTTLAVAKGIDDHHHGAKNSDSLKGKIEGEVEVRAAGGEVFHDLYANRPHHAPNAVPHILEGCDLHEGEFGKPGKIISWKFTTTGGKPIYIKCRVIEIDKEKKLVRQEVVEGDYLKDYKTLIGTNQVIPKDNETSIVKWTLEYEKLRPEVPEPTDLLNTTLAVAKGIDDHHHGVKN